MPALGNYMLSKAAMSVPSIPRSAMAVTEGAMQDIVSNRIASDVGKIQSENREAMRSSRAQFDITDTRNSMRQANKQSARGLLGSALATGVTSASNIYGKKLEDKRREREEQFWDDFISAMTLQRERAANKYKEALTGDYSDGFLFNPVYPRQKVVDSLPTDLRYIADRVKLNTAIGGK